MDEQDKKKVDDTWKNQVAKEKKEAHQNNAAYHEPTFEIFISSLGMQAMIAMGKLENPMTGKIDSNPEHARFLIDTLNIIKEKTKNNLTIQEETLLDDYLFNLRMMYVGNKKAT